ncbi:MAG: Jag N-terminal domain-containing protein [Candidatus Omnitrophota bacterium]
MNEKNEQKWNFEGVTVEEAIQNALKELKCDREDLRIKVVSEEKKGLFGMEGAEPAKIVVFKK